MGQKVNPISFRLQVTNNWLSSWYSDKNYAKFLYEDLSIRSLLSNKVVQYGISKIVIDRIAKNIILNIYTSKSSLLLKDKEFSQKTLILQISKISSLEAKINIIEIKKPDLDPSIICYFISDQLEKRASFRKVLKRVVGLAIKAGAKGIRVNIKGRLSGADIARTEWYKEGCVPLHTIRAKLGYATKEARTVYGIIGIKVWVHYNNSCNKFR